MYGTTFQGAKTEIQRLFNAPSALGQEIADTVATDGVTDQSDDELSFLSIKWRVWQILEIFFLQILTLKLFSYLRSHEIRHILPFEMIIFIILQVIYIFFAYFCILQCYYCSVLEKLAGAYSFGLST